MKIIFTFIHIKSSVLLLTFAGLISGICSLQADNKLKQEKREKIGIVWRFQGSQNRIWALMHKKHRVWKNKEIFIENPAGERIAQFVFEKKISSQGNKWLILGHLRNNTNTVLRMGYPLVIKNQVQKWVANPKRRKNPFIKQEIVQNYPQSLRVAQDNREMILVPRGKFVMGSNHGYDNEFPERIEYLDDFYIDKYELTNAQYYHYLRKSGVRDLHRWQYLISENNKDKPFDKASFVMAQKFCHWAGKKLPTEAQWEKAARGEGLRKTKNKYGQILLIKKTISYPWGNDYDAEKCNAAAQQKGPVSVYDMAECKSPYGVMHMAGNAWEWTRSWYKPYAQSHAQDRDFGEVFRVLRGGNYMSSRWDLRVSRRTPGGYPSLSRDYRGGIRCVYNVTRHHEVGP